MTMATRRNALLFIATGAIYTPASLVFSQNSVAFDQNWAAWEALLKKHVRWLPDGKQSRVNYAGMLADRAALKAVLEGMSAVPRTEFDRWSRAQQMAFLINTYNAFTIELVLTAYPRLKSIKDLGSVFQSAWKKNFFTLFGQSRNLDWIEHEQLRPRYAEPRIHAAIVCASIGCPALRPEAFTATRLEAQLEDGMARFLGDPTRNRLRDGKLEVSQIFKWFREDFEKGHQNFVQVEDVFARYAAQLATTPQDQARLRAKSVAIGYLDYDWSLNDTGR